MSLILPRRRVLQVGAGLLLAAPSIVRAGSLSLLGAGSPPTVAPSGSVWGDHGTNISLSTTAIANDTAAGNNSGNVFGTVRGAQGYSTGKHYFEVKMITASGTANGACYVGLIDTTTANGAPLDAQQPVNIATNYTGDGSTFANGSNIAGINIGSGWTLANNDIMGVAFDATNGFHYLALNNVWFLSGDPTSGASGTGHVASYTLARTYYPALTLWGLVANVVQINTSSLTFTPPSGYSAWG